MNKVYCVYPYDKTTKFLSVIDTALSNYLGVLYTPLTIYTNNKDHSNCLEKLKTLKNGELIIFLGHGGSNYLNGASGDLAESMVSDDFADDNPDQVYQHKEFITDKNAEVFANKKIFCFSCYSGKEIAQMAVSKGAICFLGFGDVPTSVEEFQHLQLDVSEEGVLMFQTELTNIILNALLFSIKRNYSFQMVANTINLFASRRASEMILLEKGNSFRRVLADTLYYFRKGISVYGNQEVSII